jgi:hypothetical protein
LWAGGEEDFAMRGSRGWQEQYIGGWAKMQKTEMEGQEKARMRVRVRVRVVDDDSENVRMRERERMIEKVRSERGKERCV